MTFSKDKALFDLQQAIYSSKNYTRRRLHQSRFHWVTNSMQKYIAGLQLPQAIEYGPGSGIYLPELAKHCVQVTGADVELAYLLGIQPLTEQIENLKLVVDDIQNSQFPDQSFDLILCSEVLEHVPNPEAALKTLYRILRPGGIAIVTTPQRYSLMELCCKVAFLPVIIQLVRCIYREPILETGHISLRSYSELSAMIANRGFQVIEHDKFGLYVPVLAEFGGGVGGRIIEAWESYVRNSCLSWSLWTQAYILRKPF